MAQVINRYNISVAKPYMSGNVEKTQWITIGDAVMMDDGKIHLNINCTPTFEWDGRASLYVKDQPSQQGGQQSQQGAQQPQQSGYRRPQQSNNQQSTPQSANQQYPQSYQPQGMYNNTPVIEEEPPF